ncbi:MAG TPA: hypothetical protein VLQ45_11345, partial [Thermoanaerobaculia bacterium]|nr:hypothetical protein [Thermoanaerobaculia bacterium]
MSEDYLDRRARMFERSPTQAGTAAPGRPSPQIGQRINPAERIRSSRSGRVISPLGPILDGAGLYIDIQRARAQKGVRDAIQQQLQPGEEVEVIVNNLDVLEGQYETVNVFDPTQKGYQPLNPETLRVCGGGPCGPQPGRLPERKEFTVPTTRGPQKVWLGSRPPAAQPAKPAKPAKPPEPKKRSPAESRPGRGEFKDWVDRWNRDPGLIDHDFDRADRIGRT